MPDIRIIKNEDIDTILWDRCVARSQNGDVFGYSWFLDSVCKNWGGIVKGNYRVVMPLPLHSFFGIPSVKNYKFQSKTDIYSSGEIDKKTTNDFLRLVKSYAKTVKITSENPDLKRDTSKIKIFDSWKLDLIRPYKDINHSETGFVIKQLNSSESNNVFFNTGILPNGITLLSTLTKSLNRKDTDTLRRLAAVSLRKNLGQIYGAFNNHNRLIAAVLFISSHYKVNIIHAVQTKEAESKKALYGLIDYYIKTHSEKALTLDFFGLNYFPEPFFKEMGAVKYPWYRVKV
ncbi:MAG: hypothetical protein J7K64_05935 [Bacteroidales bacterium]|nr:hypothetical protein [Bacteroidales bacterium]